MRLVFVLFLFFLLQACASHAVRCDARLQPINRPAAPSAPTAGSAR